jgi:hypothetical protein
LVHGPTGLEHKIANAALPGFSSGFGAYILNKTEIGQNSSKTNSLEQQRNDLLGSKEDAKNSKNYLQKIESDITKSRESTLTDSSYAQIKSAYTKQFVENGFNKEDIEKQFDFLRLDYYIDKENNEKSKLADSINEASTKMGIHFSRSKVFQQTLNEFTNKTFENQHGEAARKYFNDFLSVKLYNDSSVSLSNKNSIIKTDFTEIANTAINKVEKTTEDIKKTKEENSIGENKSLQENEINSKKLIDKETIDNIFKIEFTNNFVNQIIFNESFTNGIKNLVINNDIEVIKKVIIDTQDEITKIEQRIKKLEKGPQKDILEQEKRLRSIMQQDMQILEETYIITKTKIETLELLNIQYEPKNSANRDLNSKVEEILNKSTEYQKNLQKAEELKQKIVEYKNSLN